MKTPLKKDFAILDEMQRRQKKRLFSFSPNDALVQISLPLVLILAIATRLMIVSQSISAQESGPVILDIWKQQLILRIDKVMENWREDSQLAAFPDFSRIQWGEYWPRDSRFQQLCEKGLALNSIERMSTNLYYEALQYKPSGGGERTTAALYDPKAPFRPPKADEIPPQFRINDERREFAVKYISERCLDWREHLEMLQWSVVSRCAEELPMNDELADADIATQARKLADALAERGYPLLSSIVSEYESAPNPDKE